MRFHGIGQERFEIKDFPSQKRFQTNIRQLRSRVDPPDVSRLIGPMTGIEASNSSSTARR